MKKILIIMIAILVFVGSAAIAPDIFSENASKYTDACKVAGGVNYCCVAYNEAMGAVEQSWSDNLRTLMDQEKPGSEMVGEAYENLRTYQCWLEYICRAVQYSGYAPPSSVPDGILTSREIGVVPGCQAPQDMGVLTTGDTIASFLKDNWDVIMSLTGTGEETVNMQFPDEFFVSGKVSFIPQCMSDTQNKNTSVNVETVNSNYDSCMALLETKFACTDLGENTTDCTGNSFAFVGLETELRKNHGKQRVRILEEKLQSIIIKMTTMQQHLEYMTTDLQELDNRYACYPPKC